MLWMFFRSAGERMGPQKISKRVQPSAHLHGRMAGGVRARVRAGVRAGVQAWVQARAPARGAIARAPVGGDRDLLECLHVAARELGRLVLLGQQVLEVIDVALVELLRPDEELEAA